MAGWGWVAGAASVATAGAGWVLGATATASAAGPLLVLAAAAAVFVGVLSVGTWSEYNLKAAKIKEESNLKQEAIVAQRGIAETALMEDTRVAKERMQLEFTLKEKDMEQTQAMAILGAEIENDNRSLDNFDARSQKLLAAAAKNLPPSEVNKMEKTLWDDRVKYQKMLNDTYAYIDDGVDATSALVKATGEDIGKLKGTTPIAGLKKRGPLPKVDVFATMPLPTIKVSDKKVTPYP